jgi:hypothetical protein
MSASAHINNEEIAVYVAQKSEPERFLHIQAHIRGCSECKDRLVARVLAHMTELNNAGPGIFSSNERRSERRLERGEDGHLQSLCPLSFDRLSVQIVDVSKNGYGILMDSPLSEGAIVQLSIGKTNILGEIRTCRTTPDNRYRVGIRVKKPVN